MMWRLLHAVVAMNWAGFLSAVISELFERGEIHRSASQADTFETSFILYMVALLSATLVTALRALWLERDTRPTAKAGVV